MKLKGEEKVERYRVLPDWLKPSLKNFEVKKHIQPCYGISNGYANYKCSILVIGVSMAVSKLLVVGGPRLNTKSVIEQSSGR